jgi:hypothetical protein
VSFDMLLVEPAALLMLGAELCEVVTPSSVFILALAGLLFPFALLVFVTGVILRLSRGYWKGLLLPALVVLITFSSITSTVGGWGGTDEGYQMKSTSGWNDGGNGSNSSGFKGLPGGYRNSSGFNLNGIFGYWWSASVSGSNSWFSELGNSNDGVYRGHYYRDLGFSARCVRD